MKSYDDNQETSIIITTRNYIEQTVLLPKLTKHFHKKNNSFPYKKQYTRHFLYDWLISELFTKNGEMRNPLVFLLHADYPRIVQKSKYRVTKNNAKISFVKKVL